MAEVILFHHAQGLTPGVLAFAGRLRAAGQTVHLPDLFEGQVFATLDEGVAYADANFQDIIARAQKAAERLPEDVVYAGFSMGSASAQMLAQTRPRARGALLFHGAIPAAEFGPWPDGTALQVHTAEKDPWVDLDVARALVGGVAGAELFLYPGDHHLFADESLADYEPDSAELLMARTLTFVSRVG
jgi:dienelactone hydrolase